MPSRVHVLSINIGVERPRPGASAGGGTTGIHKLPATGPVRITRAGLPGDVICSTVHHGGPDQAVYVYGQADYAWWQAELNRPLEPGTFGENLTIDGLESATWQAGDRLLVGETLILEVTAPRVPCGTFAGRMGDTQFIERFRDAGRPGLYCRVIEEGTIAIGAAVRREVFAGDAPTMLEMFRDFYDPAPTEAAIRRFLAAPIAERARRHKEKQLATARM